MGYLRHIAIAILLSAAALCPAQEAPQLNKQQVEALLKATDALADTIRKAIIVLEGIKDKAGADAAADAVLTVIQEHEKFRAHVPDEETIIKLWKYTPLYGHLRKMPSAIYNELIRKELAERCHGSAKLAVTIAGRSGDFSEEQLAAPLSEQDAATLRRVEEHVFALIKELDQKPELTDAFLAEVDATQAGVEQLQQTPAGIMHWLSLKERYRKEIDSLRSFFCNGKLVERFVLQRATYISDFYSEQAHRYLFLYYPKEMLRNATAKAMRNKLWQDAAARLEEFRNTHKLGGGDGLTPDTAFELPPDLPLAQRAEYIDTFVREVFGEKHLSHVPYNNKMHVTKPGKYPAALQVPIIVGMLPEKGYNYYYPIILTYAYFYSTGK